MYYNKYFLFAA
jgi:hypothetical protein